MASEESTDKILDVVYGELSAEEEAAARASIASNPVDAEELAAFEALRERIHDGLAFESPRASVREAILLEAAKQASRRVEGGVRPARGQEGEARGFWSRISKGAGPQVALVAAVLLAGAFVMNIQTPSHEDALYEAAPTAQISAPVTTTVTPPPSEEAEATKAAEAAEPVAKDDATGLLAGAEQKPLAPTGSGDAAPARSSVQNQLGRGSAERAVAKAESPAPFEGAATEAKAKRAAPKPTAARQEPRTRAVSKSDYIRDNNVLDLDDSLADESARPAKKSAAPPAEEDAKFAVSAPVAAPQDKAEPEPIAEKEMVVAPGSLDAVEQAYAARDWRQVVQASDAVLESSATPVQKARALELKAMAYQQMSMFQQALNVFRNISSNYPGYQPDRIRAAQQELERRLEAKPQPSQKTRAKSYDFEEAPLNTD